VDDVAGILQKVKGTIRLTNGKKNGNKFSPKYYKSGWNGGGKSGIKTYDISKIGKIGKAIKKVTGPIGKILKIKNWWVHF